MQKKLFRKRKKTGIIDSTITELSQLKLRLFAAEELNRQLLSRVEELKEKLVKFEKIGEVLHT